MKRAAIQETSAFNLLENITSEHSPVVILSIEVHSVLRRLEKFAAKGGFELHRKWRLTQEQATHFEDPVYLLNRFIRIRDVFQHMVADYPIETAARPVGLLDIHPNNFFSLRHEISQNIFRRTLMSDDELEHWLRRNVKYSSRFEQWEEFELIQVYEDVSYSID